VPLPSGAPQEAQFLGAEEVEADCMMDGRVSSPLV
jgi:hypothetical protein